MGATATLMERPHPYQLLVELARGKVNQLRCQAADWQIGGLQIPPDLQQEIRGTASAFGRAIALADPDDANREAQTRPRLRLPGRRPPRPHLRRAGLPHPPPAPAAPRIDARLSARPSSRRRRKRPRSSSNVQHGPPAAGVEPRRSRGGDLQLGAARRPADLGRGQRPAGRRPGRSSTSRRSQLPAWLWLWERDLPSMAGVHVQVRRGGRAALPPPHPPLAADRRQQLRHRSVADARTSCSA